MIYQKTEHTQHGRTLRSENYSPSPGIFDHSGLHPQADAKKRHPALPVVRCATVQEALALAEPRARADIIFKWRRGAGGVASVRTKGEVNPEAFGSNRCWLHTLCMAVNKSHSVRLHVLKKFNHN